MTRMSRSRAGRAARLGGLVGAEAAKAAANRATDLVRSHEDGYVAASTRNTLLAERVVAVLGSMRGVAMKFGQLLSLVDPGIVAAEHRDLFQSTLASLQDSAPRVPWERMRRHLESELGAKLEVVFDEFDPRPVAAASIGQVYRARLPDGREVAVKAQYPDIASMVVADLANLRTLLTAYRLIHPRLDTAALADEIELRMREELDYRLEARHTGRLAAEFRGHPFIRIPDIVPELSGQRVIVMDWLDGRPLRAAYDAPRAERDRIAEILFRFYCGTPHLLRFYSADPHPGNVLLLADGAVGFVDFGLCQALDAATAEAEAAALRAGVEGDLDRILDLMEARGFAARSAVSPEGAYELFLRVFGWYLRDEEVEITPDVAAGLVALLGVGRLSIGSPLRPYNLPPEHVMRGRAELQLVALLGKLRPRLNLHAIAREWLFDAEPKTELGRAQRDWHLRHRPGSAPSMPETSEIRQSASRSTVTR
ncbi:ABC1 kinase family protein [Nocardia otitidiscaviarum]|uniref:ABC1 kinase family protein n=1 Tax=Nocardia otitidiscaviarum TaxID=1823 RepID=UPI00189596BA|nr:AarF/ABC1/UbiB kinase family protein [Nocardia otitidiscaviarum]MBF6180076.1 AarF/ABC1/UbiB kinase family protein [Nocardia otitidiscaviarum]